MVRLVLLYEQSYRLGVLCHLNSVPACLSPINQRSLLGRQFLPLSILAGQAMRPLNREGGGWPARGLLPLSRPTQKHAQYLSSCIQKRALALWYSPVVGRTVGNRKSPPPSGAAARFLFSPPARTRTRTNREYDTKTHPLPPPTPTTRTLPCPFPWSYKHAQHAEHQCVDAVVPGVVSCGCLGLMRGSDDEDILLLLLRRAQHLRTTPLPARHTGQAPSRQQDTCTLCVHSRVRWCRGARSLLITRNRLAARRGHRPLKMHLPWHWHSPACSLLVASERLATPAA